MQSYCKQPGNNSPVFHNDDIISERFHYSTPARQNYSHARQPVNTYSTCPSMLSTSVQRTDHFKAHIV